jgi:RNA polymerase sigma-70 factor (ECF subfamily)
LDRRGGYLTGTRWTLYGRSVPQCPLFQGFHHATESSSDRPRSTFGARWVIPTPQPKIACGDRLELPALNVTLSSERWINLPQRVLIRSRHALLGVWKFHSEEGLGASRMGEGNTAAWPEWGPDEGGAGGGAGGGSGGGAAPSFEGFVREHFSRMLQSAVYYTGNRQRAEDLLQQVLLRALIRWETIGTSPHPDRWVIVSVMHDARSGSRKNRELPVGLQLPENRLPWGSDPARQVVFDVDLQRALQQLRPDQRAAVVLCAIAGYKITEASAPWQVGERRFRLLRDQGLRAVGKLLGDSWGSFGE